MLSLLKIFRPPITRERWVQDEQNPLFLFTFLLDYLHVYLYKYIKKEVANNNVDVS
jgi:hypothetical protein